jgi:hypothetical protein
MLAERGKLVCPLYALVPAAQRELPRRFLDQKAELLVTGAPRHLVGERSA